MTTTLQSHGGGAQPASIDTSGKVAGGTALRVYGFDSADAARAAGYVCEGGPAMSVALITDAQLASGAWKAEGDPSATVIYTAPSGAPVEGGYAIPIYAVNGWGSTPAPAPVPPQFVSAEIGNVDNATVVVTFDRDVSADENDFLMGVVVDVNGLMTDTVSGIRQTNHAIVYYAITTPVTFSDTVTWNYDNAVGLIVSELDNAPLSDVNQATVTNNVPDSIGDGLRADSIAYWKMDEVSGNRLDSSGHSVDLVEYLTVASVAGKIGNAIKIIDNTEDAQELDWAGNSVSLTNGVSVFGWVKFDQFDTSNTGSEIILTARDQGGTGASFNIAVDLVSAPATPMNLIGASGALASAALAVNTWHFFAYWHISGTAYIRVNSNPVVSSAIVGTPPSFNRLGVGQPAYANDTNTYYLDEI